MLSSPAREPPLAKVSEDDLSRVADLPAFEPRQSSGPQDQLNRFEASRCQRAYRGERLSDAFEYGQINAFGGTERNYDKDEFPKSISQIMMPIQTVARLQGRTNAPEADGLPTASQ